MIMSKSHVLCSYKNKENVTDVINKTEDLLLKCKKQVQIEPFL